MNRLLKKYTFLLLFLLGSTYLLQAQKETSIHISAARSFSNFEATLPEAGSDINAIYSTSQALINLTINTFGNYRISARKEDTNWDNQLDFYIRRTGNGSGRGSIFGGTNYLHLDTFDQVFFEGFYTRSSVPIQYEFRNLSVLVPADGHTSAVIYTITSL